MKNIKRFGAIGLACLLALIIIVFTSNEKLNEKLNGKWYLYNGNDINTDSDISQNLNAEDYIVISKGITQTFRSNGKNGSSAMEIRGNKIHDGDAVFKYDINKIGEYKILILELIGYENPHMKRTVENGEKYIYVFDENINFE